MIHIIHDQPVSPCCLDRPDTAAQRNARPTFLLQTYFYYVLVRRLWLLGNWHRNKTSIEGTPQQARTCF